MARRILLIVEDDPALQREMAKSLKENGFDVLHAFDYETAVKHLENVRRKPDGVSIDLSLPSESGYELCEYIRKLPNFATLPILVTSDRRSPEAMAHAEEAGANAFLKKPFTMPRLIKYVHAILDGPHGSRPSIRRLRLN